MFNGELTPASAFERMAFIRQFEQRVFELSHAGEIAGSVHLCSGQEAIPVGALAALMPGDRVFATYRGHGWALACGSDPTGVLAEIMQREGGVNGGRAGSPFLSDPSVGFMGENSIVGAGFPIATGAALATVRQGDGRVILTSVGDGAMNQGAVTEAMVFAAAHSLPVIFICENNEWAEMTPFSTTMRSADVVERARGIGIDAAIVDGNDPFAVRDAVASAAARCRAGEGPAFLECTTVRLKGHYNRDIEHYRAKADIEADALRDPLLALARVLIDEHGWSDADVEQVRERVAARVEELVEVVVRMPSPNPASALEHTYGPVVELSDSGPLEQANLTYQRAVNQALRAELTERPELLVYGEDVGFAGGIFGVTRGLQKEFGAERVFDMPIAESAILGSAVGASMAGMRPVVEIMWADFLFVALDQVINQAANVRYVNRSLVSAPLTIRTQQGVTPGSCAQHSQSVEAILAHIPGIKVGLVATPQDAYDMTRAAIADPDPTVLIEHRALYQMADDIRTGARTQRAEGARQHRQGSDVAIITWGACLHPSLQAADELGTDGLSASVLDLRWLRPLDTDAIDRVVDAAGGKVLIVHEAPVFAGFGAEVAATVHDRHAGGLRPSVRRLGQPAVRMPSAPSLQAALLPSARSIADAARALIASGREA